MTRLVEADIFEIKKQIAEYDKTFKKQTGCSMEEIAKIAVGIDINSKNEDEIHKVSTAVATITSGLGVIGRFSETVASILQYCGVDAVEMELTDVAGLQQAYWSGREIVYAADDDVFAAFGIGSKVNSDNGEATGLGYAAALLEAMKHRGISITQRPILVLGAGSVGTAAAKYIAAHGDVPHIYDPNIDKAKKLADKINNAQYIESEVNFLEYPYIVDASTAGGIIGEKDVTKDSIIAAAGMPCVATEQAKQIATVIHNTLELGVITMYFQCIQEMAYGSDKENSLYI